jgi:hypothetical protein
MKNLNELSKAKCCKRIKGTSKTTGEVIILNSLVEIQTLGGNSKYLSAMLNGNKSYHDYVGFYFEYLDQPTRKKLVEHKTNGIKVEIKNYKPIKRINKKTGEVKTYAGLKEVVHDGFNKSTISNYANNKKSNNSEYEWRYE